jgi:F-type H+-transporting ATPase subunit gamma
MSGKLKEVRTRIASVKNTQQITKAMKMVSAAKLRKAQDAILQMRPYALKMTDILANLTAATEGEVEIEMAKERPIERVLIVAVTSDRGLCGSFNANVLKLVKRHTEENYAEQLAKGNVDIMAIGKKAADGLKYSEQTIHQDFAELFGNLSFDEAVKACDWIKEAYSSKKYDRVDVVFNSFKNAATQILLAEQFLPIKKVEQDAQQETENTGMRADFLFEPDMHTMVEELVPRILNTQFFRYLLDSNASEHGARMTAMDQATENANDLLKDLRITYNRARQAAITTELTEIVSGAAALAGN